VSTRRDVVVTGIVPPSENGIAGPAAVRTARPFDGAGRTSKRKPRTSPVDNSSVNRLPELPEPTTWHSYSRESRTRLPLTTPIGTTARRGVTVDRARRRRSRRSTSTASRSPPYLPNTLRPKHVLPAAKGDRRHPLRSGGDHAPESALAPFEPFEQFTEVGDPLPAVRA
jgi:hypothetical protein